MSKLAWLTPDNPAPASRICRTIRIPNSIEWISVVNGALLSLTESFNWEEFGSMTPDEAASLMANMWDDYDNSGSVCMIGMVFPYVTQNPPDGSLSCDGATYNRVDYPSLYDILDPAFVVDADSFIVPDLRDSFPVGAGSAYAPNDQGGENSHTLTVPEMPGHSHADAGHTHAEGIALPAAFNLIVGLIPAAVPAVGVTGIGFANLTNTGGGGSHENRPPFVALNYAVWAR